MSHTSASHKLLTEAADCGLRITGLDGWTQTRLAETLKIRRETLNAIINQSPGAEPTPQRPRMVEACRKLITFAAALSAKEDAILKLPVDLANLQSDDGQAYEHHRLRLHKLVEAAAADGRYTDALCRIGEFASAALHAADAYRLRMICNLVTAIQRLLDKPACREVPQAVIAANLGRLYRAERAARSIRMTRAGDATREQAQYVSGQVGYALIFTGLLLPDPRLIHRGGRRLFQAVQRQPDSSYGHWCNLLRATDDLLAVDAPLAREWAARAKRLGAKSGDAFESARDALQRKGEIAALTAYWATGKTPGGVAVARGVARLALWALGFALALGASAAARAGDGRDFRGNSCQAPTQQNQTPPPTQRTRIVATAGLTASDDAALLPMQRRVHVVSLTDSVRAIPRGSDVPLGISRAEFDDAVRAVMTPPAFDPTPSAGVPMPIVVAPPDTAWVSPAAVAPRLPPAREVVSVSAMSRLVAEPADRARSALSIARNYLAVGKPELAQAKLRQLLSAYPNAPEAAEAKTLLASTGK